MDSLKKSSISSMLCQENIPDDFRIHWLNKTLKFVKNDKELLLKYPEMPANQIKFLKVMITSSNTNECYSSLWEALKLTNLKYDFQMYVERTSSDHGHLFLKKKLKLEDNVDADTGSSDTLPSPKIMEKKEGKRKRKKKKFVHVVKEQVESISPLFIKNTLGVIFAFIKDERQASLPFDNLSRLEAQFLYDFNGILRRKECLEELFSPLCNVLWTKINDALNDADNFKIEVSSINVDPDTFKRQLTLSKTPKFSNRKIEKNKSEERPDIENEPANNTERYKSINSGSKLLKAIDNCANNLSQTQTVPTSVQCNQNQPEPLIIYTKPIKHTRESSLKGAEPLFELSKCNSEPINGMKSSRNDIKPSIMKTEAKILNIEPQINGMEPSINEIESLTNKMEQSMNDLELSVMKSEQPKCNMESSKNGTKSLLSSVTPLTNNMEPQITNFIMRNGIKIPTVEKTVVGRKRNFTIPSMTRDAAALNGTSTDTSGLPKGKIKLIEALSKPLESEVGLRMMRCMGWEGGSLGAREGGITEPIMPAIHLKAKAGLGHIEKPKTEKSQDHKPKSTKTLIAEYRLHVLETILRLLNSASSSEIIEFVEILNRRQINFLDNINKSFKNRKDLGVCLIEEKVLATNILTFLSTHPDLYIEVQPITKQQVEIKKLFQKNVMKTVQTTSIQKRLEVGETSPQSPNVGDQEQSNEPLIRVHNQGSSDNRPLPNNQGQSNQPITNIGNQGSSINVANQESSDQTPINEQNRIDEISSLLSRTTVIAEDLTEDQNNEEDYLPTDEQILTLLNLKEQFMISKESLMELKFRVFIMKTCLNFVKSDSISFTINCKLSSSVQNFLRILCTLINLRKLTEIFIFSIEKFLWLEIMCCVKEKDLYMSVGMDSKSFYLSKLLPTLTQSSLNINTSYANGEVDSTDSSDSTRSQCRIIDEKNTALVQNEKDAKNIFYFRNTKNKMSDCIKLSEEKFNFGCGIASKSNNIPFKNVRIIQRIGKTMTIDIAKEIQNRISSVIISTFLPKLKCHGIRNDSLIYSCYDKKSYDFLKEVLSDCQVVEYELSRLFKMAATFKSQVTLAKLFHWLWLYHNLDATKWNILSTTLDNYMHFTVSMDQDSFHYVCVNNFKLFVGIDEITFEIIV